MLLQAPYHCNEYLDNTAPQYSSNSSVAHSAPFLPLLLMVRLTFSISNLTCRRRILLPSPPFQISRLPRLQRCTYPESSTIELISDISRGLSPRPQTCTVISPHRKLSSPFIFFLSTDIDGQYFEVFLPPLRMQSNLVRESRRPPASSRR